MSALSDLISDGSPVANCHPWQRAVVTVEGWQAAAAGLTQGTFSLLGLWGRRRPSIWR